MNFKKKLLVISSSILLLVKCGDSKSQLLANVKEKNVLFCEAVLKDDSITADKIIKQGFNINSIATGYQDSFLTLAIKRKSNKVLKILFENKVSIKYLELDNGKKIEYGVLLKDPMILAIENNNSEAVRLMAEAGLNINKEIDEYAGIRKMSYLIIASSKKKSAQIVSLLIKYGAKINKCDQYGDHALNYAASVNNYEVIPLLIRAKSNINKQGYAGRTALDHAIIEKGRESEIILKKYGAKKGKHGNKSTK